MVEGSGIQSEEGGSAAWVKHHKRNGDITSVGHEVERPKVVSAAIEVERLAQVMKTFTIEFTHILWGTAYYKEHGRYVDENVLDVLKIYGVALFRSVGAPSISPPFLPKTDLGTNEINRRPRPHLHLGSSPRHPRPPPTLHQRPPVRTFPGIRSPSAWSAPPISTGSSCVKTAKVSTPATAAVLTATRKGGSYRSRDLHLRRRRAYYSLFVCGCAGETEEAIDGGDEE
jgi:hypothetical protein